MKKLFLLILLCLVSPLSAQTYLFNSIDFGKKIDGSTFTLSENGKYLAVLISDDIQGSEILVIDNNLKKTERYKVEAERLNNLSFTQNNRYIYPKSIIGGRNFSIIDRESQKVININNRTNDKSRFVEEFNSVSFENETETFKITGTQCTYDINYQECENRKFYIFDYKNELSGKKEIEQSEVGRLKFLVTDEYKTGKVFFNNEKHKNIVLYQLEKGEKLISRNYNQTNATVSIIIKEDEKNYQNKNGKIILYSLTQNIILKTVPIQIENQNWVMYSNGVQLSDDGKTLVYSNGICVNSINVDTLNSKNLFCKDRVNFLFDDQNKKIYYADYWYDTKISIYNKEQ
jgi:hypothetical protein